MTKFNPEGNRSFMLEHGPEDPEAACVTLFIASARLRSTAVLIAVQLALR